MSKTISFVATDKLAEWLEDESERRMTTISSTAQQLLAEKFREDHKEDITTRKERESEETGNGDRPGIFDRHPNKWYNPNSDENDYAVELPNGNKKYYKTRDGAAKRLRREYE